MADSKSIRPWNCDGPRADPLQAPAGLNLRGIFLSESPGNAQHAWLIDSFNLYHAICSLERGEVASGLRWLNPRELAKRYLKTGEHLEIWYFTATPYHLKTLDPASLNAHLAYQRALTALRPKVYLETGVFSQEKVMRRDREGRMTRWSEWREKGTDVSLALRAVSLANNQSASTLTIVSGDSDFVPLAKLFKSAFPKTFLRFAFPPGRFSHHLAQLAPGSFSLNKHDIIAAKMENGIRLPSGKQVVCPEAWK